MFVDVCCPDVVVELPPSHIVFLLDVCLLEVMCAADVLPPTYGAVLVQVTLESGGGHGF